MGSEFNVETVLEAVLSKLRVLAETGQTFGQPITIGETIIVPYMSLHFGLGGVAVTLAELLPAFAVTGWIRPACLGVPAVGCASSRLDFW